MWLWITGVVLLVLAVVGLWAGKKSGRDADPRTTQDPPDPRPYYFGSGGNTGAF
ncbi:hypothetical protein [Georgenia thermotolerans]|uniref:Uncharacterized protein n=1 Tax=Georgenia thermotolerans TaxID=527326 RepID=A0A7J5UTH4_9MICO|nr:hypothetical protein [Georgenia thermotolerans]KAE8765576.1 hypothetical protein GB883_03390 [Georgenia thermotolerans]